MITLIGCMEVNYLYNQKRVATHPFSETSFFQAWLEVLQTFKKFIKSSRDFWISRKSTSHFLTDCLMKSIPSKTLRIKCSNYSGKKIETSIYFWILDESSIYRNHQIFPERTLPIPRYSNRDPSSCINCKTLIPLVVHLDT